MELPLCSFGITLAVLLEYLLLLSRPGTFYCSGVLVQCRLLLFLYAMPINVYFLVVYEEFVRLLCKAFVSLRASQIPYLGSGL